MTLQIPFAVDTFRAPDAIEWECKKEQETSVIQIKCNQIHASSPVVTAKCNTILYFHFSYSFVYYLSYWATVTFYFNFIWYVSIANCESENVMEMFATTKKKWKWTLFIFIRMISIRIWLWSFVIIECLVLSNVIRHR